MNPKAAQNYLRTKVMTATPEQLQLMLFDGAIRFGEQARIALQNKHYDQSYKLLTSAQKIVTELKNSLKPDVAPDLCKKLTAIYNYTYRKLIDANLRHTIESLDEAMRMLKYQRETWVMLMGQLGKEKAGRAAQSIDIPEPDPRMENSFSVQG
ncbi:MAG: flagellar export chaperone FliS [Tepidisphaeraceae bacterium]